MKKTFLISALTLVYLVILSASAFAGINNRLAKQHRRIHNGIHDGSLTRSEAKSLKREHRKIRDLRERFLRNGHLSRNERQSLNRKLDRASDHIYRLKHNKRFRHKHRHYRDCDRYHWGRGYQRHDDDDHAWYPFGSSRTGSFYGFRYYKYGDD